MARRVKPEGSLDLRAARVADTEERILRAASELFVERGYAATTLAAVAESARVGARTVYVRFGTKAVLLKRAVDVALVGDTAEVDVRGRDWFQVSLNAPTAAERIAASTRGARDMMARVGPLLRVAQEAEAVEPEIAAAAQAGREYTRDSVRLFWERMSSDGLLPPGCDVDWLADTTSVLAHGDTYVTITRTMHWTPEQYEDWLTTTWTRLSGV
ncbi:MAG: TetR/AcrR family transcriptional regulator [Pseudonocardiales bacterium]|nr:TetR/AcrR family transcriptional regulator [Pseudonocardiales bacterium]